MNSKEIFNIYGYYNSLKSDYDFLNGLDLDNLDLSNTEIKRKIASIIDLKLFDPEKSIENKEKEIIITGNTIKINSRVRKLNKHELFGKILNRKLLLRKELNYYRNLINSLIINNPNYNPKIKEEN